MSPPALLTRSHSRWALGLVGIGTAARLLLAPSYGYLGVDGDLLEHKQALHRILTLGFHRVYDLNPRNDPALTGGEWNGGFFMNNLPAILYVRTPLAWLYRSADPAGLELWDSSLNWFELERTDLHARLAATRGLTVLLKLPGILADAGIAWWAFLVAQRRAAPGIGVAAAGALALGPGLIWNTAFWGQHDSAWCLLVVIALAFLSRGGVELGWSAAALALATKPQALAFGPLIAVLGLARAKPSRWIGGALAAIAVGTLVFLPFLLHGTAILVLRWLARSTFGGEPFVSCYAANIWWLVSGGDGYSLRDDEAWLGPLTPRSLGLLAFVSVYGWVLWFVRRRESTEVEIYLAGACVAQAFFTVCTEMHENHGMAVVPLLALGCTARPRLVPPLLVLASLALFCNLVLFDPAAAPPGLRPTIGAAAPSLALGISMLNVGLLGALLAGLRHQSSRGGTVSVT